MFVQHLSKSMVAKIKIATGLLALSLIAGCAGDDENALNQVEQPPQELYNAALNEVVNGNLVGASQLFDEVERQHPYSTLAVEAQLMAAWALYQANNYPAAGASLDRFIELNPAHPDIEYAYYLKAQSFYEQIVDVERDGGMTVLAKQAFEALINRFPNGKYSRDAQLKIDLANSHLAGKEMAIGRFYLKRGHYNAALSRFRIVLEAYDQSNQTPEALFRMSEGYLALGLDEEAERSAAVLAYNYPDSVWTSRVYHMVDTPETDPDESQIGGFLERIIPVF